MIFHSYVCLPEGTPCDSCFRRPVSSLEILRSLSVAWHCERQNWCQGASNHWASQRFFFYVHVNLTSCPTPSSENRKNHETPMALESQHEYIYIWYTIYNICYTYIYIYVIYIYMSVVRLSKGWVCSPGISWCCWRGSLPRIAHGFWGALSDKCMSIDIILTYIQ